MVPASSTTQYSFLDRDSVTVAKHLRANLPLVMAGGKQTGLNTGKLLDYLISLLTPTAYSQLFSTLVCNSKNTANQPGHSIAFSLEVLENSKKSPLDWLLFAVALSLSSLARL